ncbi:hypothetical protein [Gordonia sp. NPDC003429]
MRTGRSLPTLYAVSVALTALILAPILRPGYLLYRDAVSTPRSFVTDTALGLGDLPPRAVPQDWLVALGSSVVDGGLLVTVILCAALILAGVGYGRLALRLTPGRTGAVAAATIAIWNPFVAQRLLQGHWGLLVGYAALGWIVVAVADLAERPDARRWLQLGGLLAVAGLTPTGSLLALLTLIVAAAGAGAGGRRRWAGAVAMAALWVVSAAPWLLAALLGAGGTGTDGVAGVRAFGLRSEPGLGPLGTALGLGGIWNADAVPASRTIWWAAVATVCFVGVVAVGAVALWRTSSRTTAPLVWALAGLATVTVLLVAASATAPGRAVLAWLVDAIPGGGLLRDTSKFLALAMPFVAVCASAAVGALRTRVPAGFALAAVVLAVVAPLPDLAWGVGGRIGVVHYPDDWARVADSVPADTGSVAVWPPGTVRRYPFADGPSLNPWPRMLRAPVIESGELVVDGRVVDAAAPHARAVDDVLRAGGDPAALARLGVGWVLIDTPDTAVPQALSGQLRPEVDDSSLTVFRIPDAAPPSAPSSAARAAMWAAHLLWLAMIVVGAGAAILRVVRTPRRNRPR